MEGCHDAGGTRVRRIFSASLFLCIVLYYDAVYMRQCLMCVCIGMKRGAAWLALD